MTLTEFLLARIAEDEAVARAASTGQHWTWDDRGENLMSEHTYPIGTMTGQECIIATEGANPPDPDQAGAHIARHDPARVLAECEAKRQVVALLGDYEDGFVWAAGESSRAQQALEALALPYEHHPDYQQEWKP